MAVLPGHSQVRYHKLVPSIQKTGQGFVAINGTIALYSDHFEGAGQLLTNRPFIVYDQDFRWG
jgi:hypothetical protein